MKPSRVMAVSALVLVQVAWGAELAGVASVIDGDTLEVHGTKIRLLGVDAVESSQTCRTDEGEQWPCGRRAALALADFIGRQTVRCESKDTDRYGRTVAVCFVGSRDVNAWLVREGWAVAYTRYSKAYIDAETQARAQKRNIWSGSFTRPEDYRRGGKGSKTSLRSTAEPKGGCTIKGNISAGGKIYHLPGTEWYGRTGIDKEKGERWFCSEAEAIAAGWRKAGARSPSPSP